MLNIQNEFVMILLAIIKKISEGNMTITISATNYPLQYSNDNLVYSRRTTEVFSKILNVQIKNGETVIGNGIVLDFYKNFKNKPETNETYAFYNIPKDKMYTPYGLYVNNIKYGNSDLNDEEKDSTFESIVKKIVSKGVLSTAEEDDIYITSIPSSAEIPQNLVLKIQETKDVKSDQIISINKLESEPAKNNDETNYDNKIAFLDKKYIINNIKDKQYIIIDDVFGTGFSMAHICNKIYNEHKITPFFYCICKDVKR